MTEGAKVYATRESMVTSTGVPTEDYQLPDGSWLQLRGLNREEALQIAETKGTRAREIKMVAWGMVTPPMTYQEVETWFKGVQAGVIQDISEVINRLSGLNEKAEAEAVDRFRDPADD